MGKVGTQGPLWTTDPGKVGSAGGWRIVGARGDETLDEVFSVKQYGTKTKAKAAANVRYKQWIADNPIDPSQYKPMGPEPGTVNPQQRKQSIRQARELRTFRKRVDVWTKNWIKTHVGDYGPRHYDKFEKALIKAWNIERLKPQYQIGGLTKLLKMDGLPPVTPTAGTTTIKGKDVVVQNKNPFEIYKLKAPSRANDKYINPSFKKYFYAGVLEKNPKLKKDITQFMNDVLMNKSKRPGMQGYNKWLAKIYERMGSNPDVIFMTSPDIGITSGTKKELFERYFPPYRNYMEKLNRASLLYKKKYC